METQCLQDKRCSMIFFRFYQKFKKNNTSIIKFVLLLLIMVSVVVINPLGLLPWKSTPIQSPSVSGDEVLNDSTHSMNALKHLINNEIQTIDDSEDDSQSRPQELSSVHSDLETIETEETQMVNPSATDNENSHNDSLTFSISDDFIQEPVNDDWASTQYELLTDLIENNPHQDSSSSEGLNSFDHYRGFYDIECRSIHCKITFSTENPEDFSVFMNHFLSTAATQPEKLSNLGFTPLFRPELGLGEIYLRP